MSHNTTDPINIGTNKLQTIKVKVQKFLDFIQWNLYPYKKDDSQRLKEALFSLKKNSFFVYKNFLNKNDISNLKKKIYLSIKKRELVTRKEIIFRQKFFWDPSDLLFKDIINSNIISTISKKFYNSKNVEFMKIVYEKKKGKKKIKIKDAEGKVGDFQYHCDRNYGWLKFCLILKDINDNDGPFCLIPTSHKWPRNIYDLKYRYYKIISVFSRDYKSISLPTFKKKEISKFFNINKEKRLTGNEGDLLMINTASYHKGDIPKEGCEREVLWFYTRFPSNFESFLKKIKSILK